MKVSEIQIENIAEYLRLDIGDLSGYEKKELEIMLAAAKSFVKSYTGLANEAIDSHEDIAIVVLVLSQDMYDNRTLYVDSGNLNKIVDTILGMYSVNLI